MPANSVHLFGSHYTLGELRQWMPSLDTVGGLRPLRLVEGPERDVLAIEFRTGTGFEFTVVPDRGMNICFARYRGVPLDWSSGVGVIAPAYYESDGWQWLRSFHGGLVHTCGLDNVGVPVTDGQLPWDNQRFGGHGRISNTPAREVCWRTEQKDGRLVLEVHGKVHCISALEQHLILERSVRTELGSSALRICDRITNLGHHRTPFFLLYHCNFGFPLVSPESRLSIPAASAVDIAGKPVENLAAIEAPLDGGVEQVLYPEIAADTVTVTLVNPRLERDGLGVFLRYRREQLPYTTVWKQFVKRFYALGIEPGTCRVEGRVVEREKGRAVELDADESYEVELEFGVLE